MSTSFTVADEFAGERLLKVQRFRDDSVFSDDTEGEAIIQRIDGLQRRIGLLEEAGLKSAAREEQGELQYLRYCLRHRQGTAAELTAKFGMPLTGEQQKVLFTRFPVVYQWGFHPREGNLEIEHLRKYGRSGTHNWTWHTGTAYVNFTAACWQSYNFTRIPTSVLEEIRFLQDDPLTIALHMLTPKDAISDPVLVATCYKIGRRLVARWGEALTPIKGLDS